MKCLVRASFVVVLCLACRVRAGDSPISIVLEAQAHPAVRIAAAELSGYLQQLYPAHRFILADQSERRLPAIYLGCSDAVHNLVPQQDRETLRRPEGYVLCNAEVSGRSVAVVAGSDPAGVMYGAYGLLRRLGCGFYLSFDALPQPRQGGLDLDDWRGSDVPLVYDRIVFNWHNFLSGCSSWDLEHWKQWISQSQKAGYNAVMVHAYGNNPMAGFAFGGHDKPVGYLSSTEVGRDWATQHVNDVRRLWGGDVFEGPVFGSEASVLGDDRRRTEAAQRIMAEAFGHAEDRSVKVYFAVDVDTVSANPQLLIRSLPEEARFSIRTQKIAWMGQEPSNMWLANPDTAEGFAYYKAQVEHLLRTYPQIDCLVVWFRTSATPWMGMKLEDFPADWQHMYEAAIRRTPEIGAAWRAHNLFAVSRIVEAFARVLKEVGRVDVELGIGSWGYSFFPAAHRFMPRDVKFIPLDQTLLRGVSFLETPDLREVIASAGRDRPVLPVRWAHHDDGHYLGRPYVPNGTFYTKLQQAHAQGFGIIHWTTRPLDVFFDSLSRQSWQSTRDEALEQTCHDMARRCFGSAAASTMGSYLLRWLNEAPNFSRETSPHFFDPSHKLAEIAPLEQLSKERISLLESIDRASLTDGQAQRLEYFKGLEQFIVQAHRCEHAYRLAEAELRAGRPEAARQAIRDARAEPVIEHFARFCQFGGITRGEQGTVVSMNTRWLPHIVSLRQQLRMEPIRYNFAATAHDPLAQSPGRYTFHFGPKHDLWQCLGERETGAETFSLGADENIVLVATAPRVWAEVARTGIESAEPIRLSFGSILSGGGSIPPGRHDVTILVVEPAQGGCVFDVRISVSGDQGSTCRFEPTRAKYLRVTCRGSDRNNWNSIRELRCAALDRAGPVTASASVEGHEPAKACDGDGTSRWAAQGRSHWIQFALQQDVTFDRVDIDWYEGQRRKYDFSLSVSSDGRKWTSIEPQKKPTNSAEIVDRVDVLNRAGAQRRLAALTYPVTLSRPGKIELTLTPVRGKALLCGLVIEPDASNN